MAFTKIVEGDLTNKGVRGLPDTPNLGTTDMQNKFEEISVDVIVPKHNGLIDELEATTAAASIGALDANGDPSTVQDELVSIKSDAYTKAQADALFLTQTDAADTYLTQADATATYLTQTDAASTYLSQTDAASTYLSQTDADSDYLKKTDAASTYLAQTDAASTYLSQSDAASTYVAQVSGKDLSSNDYTDADKTKLAGIEAGANNYVLPAGTQSTLGGVMGDGTTFTIDSNGVGHAVGGGGGTSDYDALINHPKINSVELIGDKTTSDFGFEGEDIGYDNTTSGLTATDLQNAVDEVVTDLNGKADTSSLATVATSGSYTDLIDKPTIPTALSDLTDDATHRVVTDTEKTTWSGKASTTDVSNTYKVTSKQVATTGWTSDTTSQSGTTLYKKTIALSHVYVTSPSVDIGASGVLPTTAQQEAYNLLQYVTINGTTLTLYASAIPSTSFYINIEGVD